MEFFKNNLASSVIFATLMLILVAIVAASGIAFFVSLSEKEYMQRQSMLDAQKNENLKIVSIVPSENPSDPKYWDGFNFTIFNNDINDARITAISVNDKFMIERYVDDGAGGTTPYNQSTAYIDVPAGEAIKLHVGAINFNGIFYSNGTLTNTPNSTYLGMDSSGWLQMIDSNGIDVNDTIFVVKSNNTTPDSFTMLNNTSYPCNVFYTLLPNNEPYSVDSLDSAFLKTKPVKVELITQRENSFSKLFYPPSPIANMQYIGSGTGQFLVLDGSGSTAPNGFVTKYKWDITSGNNTSTLYGIKQQYSYVGGNNYSIDLTVTDNYGMTSDLSNGSGNITI